MAPTRSRKLRLPAGTPGHLPQLPEKRLRPPWAGARTKGEGPREAPPLPWGWGLGGRGALRVPESMAGRGCSRPGTRGAQGGAAPCPEGRGAEAPALAGLPAPPPAQPPQQGALPCEVTARGMVGGQGSGC